MRVIRAANLLKLPGINHGFFTRQGGVSVGLYESLNSSYSSGDSATAVTENRRRICEHLQGRWLVTACQVHGAEVVNVDTPWEPQNPPEADALVTTRKGIVIAVQTADCVPVLLADKKKNVIGAVHAGWQGCVKGVIPQTVKLMKELGTDPENLSAAVGPCIGPHSYEVSIEFLTPFLIKNPENRRFFLPANKPGHMMFDIAGFAVAELEGLGIKDVMATGQDTYADPEQFFSYRRSRHRVEPDYGRQLSAIVLA